MSRFCMYCGNELSNDEICSCTQSVNARKRKESASNSDSSTTNNTDSNNTTYQYSTQQTPPPQSKNKEKKKGYNTFNKWKTNLKNKTDKAKNPYQKQNFIKDFGHLIKDFIKNPIYTVTNPGSVSKGAAMLLIALLGIFTSLVFFFFSSGLTRSIFSIFSRIIGFKGTQGFVDIANMILNIISVTAIAYIQFFIFTGIFYLIQKYIFRKHTNFWDFAIPFAISTIPITLMCVIGIIFSFFSIQTVILLLAASLVLNIILNYEILKNQWLFIPSDKSIYIISIGYFLYLSFCISILKMLLM